MPDDKFSNAAITPPPAQREMARKRAQNHFAASEQRDSDVRKEIARQQAVTQTQMAKLRALRLAKEEEDRIAAANAPKPAPKPRKPKVIKVR
jgi:hypothetical protein